MGTSGDNGALGLANQQLVDVLGATTPDIQLANMVYSLMAGAFMVAGGLVGTIIGWRTNFRLGAALCAAGELVMALSPNMTIFIWGGRILVGFGASFMIPSVLGLIPFIYHGKNRVLAFGCIGAASGLSAFLPLFLGIVMQFGGFRITFGALAVYFALVLLLSFKLPAIEKPAEKLKFDGLGTGIAATGLFLFLVGLSRISAWGLIEPFAECPFTIFGISPALPMAVLGLILLVILVPVEKRVEQKNGIALLPQSFLKTPQVRAGLVASAITFFFMGVQAILLSPYLQLVAGWSPVLMGVMALAVGIPTFIFSLGIPKFLPNANPRRVIQVGYIVMASAFIPMAFSLHGSEVNGLMWVGLAVAGAGAGIVSAQANNIVALAVNERDASQSGGIQTTMRNVGQAIGVAAIGAVLLFGITANIDNAMADSPVITPEVRTAVAERNISLMGDEQFEQTIADIPMTDEQRTELVQLNSDARIESTITSYVVSGVLILLGLFTTRWITIFKKEEDGKEETIVRPRRPTSCPSSRSSTARCNRERLKGKFMKRLFTMPPSSPWSTINDTADALLVDDDGRIAYIGTLEEARRLAEDAEEVDLGGAAVLPRAIDPHSHFTGALQYLLYADLSECTSFAEITETLKKFAAERNIGPDGVIMGNGYDQNNLIEQRHPDKSILNAVSEDVPVSSRTCPTTWAGQRLPAEAGRHHAHHARPRGRPLRTHERHRRLGRLRRGAGGHEPLLRRDHSPLGPGLRGHGARHAAHLPGARRDHLPGRRHRARHGQSAGGPRPRRPAEDGHRELSHVGLGRDGHARRQRRIRQPELHRALPLRWPEDVPRRLAPGADRLDDRALRGGPRRREGLGGLQHHDRRGCHRLREDGHRLQPPASVPLQRRRGGRPASARVRDGARRVGQPREGGPAPGDDPRPDGAHRPVREDGGNRHDPLDLSSPRTCGTGATRTCGTWVLCAAAA